MNNYVIPTIDWTAAMPVIVVFVTGIAALLIEMFRPRQNNNVIVGISLTGLAVAAYLLASQVGMPAIDTFAGMIRRDHLGLMLQLLMVVACGLTFLFGENYLRERRMAYGEFYPLAIWSTAGGMIMVGTDHLLMIFIGLEVLSISLYCMAGLAREEQRSAESALKYFLLGSLASAFLLYGIAFFYGATGTLSLTQIGMYGAQMNMQILATAFVLIGLGFKASLFPFHMWTPDVYQGAPTNVSAFLATVSKIAALGLMARMLPVLGQTQDFWFPVLFWLSMLTMTVGNVSAIGQTDLKRTLGFSSIAHAGYVMVALLAHLKNPKVVSLDAMVFYLAVYSVATIGAFAVLTLAVRNAQEDARASALHGLWKRNRFAAGAFIVFLISLIGIPFTGGFLGKLLIFQGALKADLLPLAIVLGVNSAISVAYYLYMAKAVFVDEEELTGARVGQTSGGLKLTCVVCAAAVFGSWFFGSAVQSMLAAPNEASVKVERPVIAQTQR